jgi:hypothetical protein
MYNICYAASARAAFGAGLRTLGIPHSEDFVHQQLFLKTAPNRKDYHDEVMRNQLGTGKRTFVQTRITLRLRIQGRPPRAWNRRARWKTVSELREPLGAKIILLRHGASNRGSALHDFDNLLSILCLREKNSHFLE